jgi:hypothetical protein
MDPDAVSKVWSPRSWLQRGRCYCASGATATAGTAIRRVEKAVRNLYEPG